MTLNAEHRRTLRELLTVSLAASQSVHSDEQRQACKDALSALLREDVAHTQGRNSRAYAVNESGRRVGESHPRAKLTDDEIDRMFELHQRGRPTIEIANQFGVHRTYVNRVLKHKARNQLAKDWRPRTGEDMKT